MSPQVKSSPSVGLVVLAAIPAAAAMLAALSWLLLMLFATAMGSKAPTMPELLALVWPSLAGGLLAVIAIFLLIRRHWLVSILASGAGLAAVAFGVLSIMP